MLVVEFRFICIDIIIFRIILESIFIEEEIERFLFYMDVCTIFFYFLVFWGVCFLNLVGSI